MSPYMQDPDRQGTPQEDQLTEFMLAGEPERVDQMRESAALEPQEPPTESPPEDWLSPADQFELDAQNAWLRYQDANEAPEDERVANTAERVADENADADANVRSA